METMREGREFNQNVLHAYRTMSINMLKIKNKILINKLIKNLKSVCL